MKHWIFIGGAMMLLAALVFAGTVFMYLRATPPAASSPAEVHTAAAAPNTTIVEDVPHYSTNLALGTGTIVAIEGTTLTIKLKTIGETKSFEVAASAEIFADGETKDPAVWKKESDEFYRKIAAAGNMPITYVGPDPFVHVPVPFKNLKVGNDLFLVPTSDSTADKIRLGIIRLAR